MNFSRFAFLAALLSFAEAAPLTRESIIRDRELKIGSLKSNLKFVQGLFKDHQSGKKIIDDPNRLSSLEKRVQHYKAQIYDYSEDLTEEEIQQLIDNSAEL